MSVIVTLEGSSAAGIPPFMASLTLTNGQFGLQAESGVEAKGFAGVQRVTVTQNGVFVALQSSGPMSGSFTFVPILAPGQPVPIILLEGVSGGTMQVSYPSADRPTQILEIVPYQPLALAGYQA